MAKQNECSNPELVQQGKDGIGHSCDRVASWQSGGVTKPRKIWSNDIEVCAEMCDLLRPLFRSAQISMDKHQRLAVTRAAMRQGLGMSQFICSGNHSAKSGMPINNAISNTIMAMKGRQPMMTSPMVT